MAAAPSQEVPEFTLPTYWTHPEGIFDAQLVDFESETTKYGPSVKWIYETGVPRDDEKPARLSFRTGTSFGAKSNLVNMLTSLGLQVPATREEAANFSPNDLIGLQCRIEVRHSLKSDNSGDVWANITRLAPAKGQASASRPHGTQPPAAEPAPANGATKKADPFED